MPIPSLIGTIEKKPGIALAAAAIFQVIVTLTIFGIGRFELMPRQFDRDGIGEFARDSHSHKAAAEELSSLLKQAQFGPWIGSPQPLHIKIDSLSLLIMSPLVGSNILAVEPANLLCYLVVLMLTFSLTKIVAGGRAAWVAAFIVALWPSLILHTTQVLRDPSVLAGFLALMGILVMILRKTLAWLYAAAMTVAGTLSIYILWHSRPEMWLVLTSIVFVCGFLLVIQMLRQRKLCLPNLVVILLLSFVAVGMPRPAVGPVSQPLLNHSGWSSIWIRIALARQRFIIEGTHTSGSMIDEDVVFASPADVIKYLPRALEIGYLAPFPSMWFKTGHNVGLAGRLISGIEMSLTYLLEILACVFIWRHRRDLSNWLLALTTLLGMLALGLVVKNTGTLYRMRYPFWTLLVIMGAGGVAQLWTSDSNAASVPSTSR